MANTRYNADAIKKRGGRVTAVCRVDANGSPIAGESFFDLGSKAKSVVTIKKTKEPIKDEAGEIVAYDVGELTAEVKITGLQTDSATLNFFTREVEDQNFKMISHCGQGSGTASEYAYIPFGEFDYGYEVDFSQRTFDVTFRPKTPNFAWSGASLTASTNSTTGWNSAFSIANPTSLSASLSGTGRDIIAFAEV
jgi:hypothetical protein